MLDVGDDRQNHNCIHNVSNNGSKNAIRRKKVVSGLNVSKMTITGATLVKHYTKKCSTTSTNASVKFGISSTCI